MTPNFSLEAGDTTLERCARAMYAEHQQAASIPWEDLSDFQREVLMNAARACIGAMLPVSDEVLTVLRREVVDGSGHAFYMAIRAIAGGES